MNEHGLTQEEVAQQVGKSRPTVANAMRLLALPDPVLQLLEEEKLSAGHARALLSLSSGSQQREAAQRVVNEGLSVRQTEALVKSLMKEAQEAKAHGKEKTADPHKMYRDAAAKELTARFGRKVSIVHGAKRGSLSFEYYNDDDLNDLLDLLEQIKVTAKAKTPKGGSKA